ncbi:hypothetical protein L211DRAFT_845425 [Terfezia boudieri ATCC MYA-4762]|uniref:Uncharacterized protein n=1 Tax=Terfezia boudieri ATCC MYA-4762 TaxID=1051890 RepID=A0A3N4LZW5_9PEZI|nr:hypothetical protein L211DRAFT_845425 [Terfezia boudieri ATCC MYA-4762]
MKLLSMSSTGLVNSINSNASLSVFPVLSKATRNLANSLHKSQSPYATAIASSRTISFELEPNSPSLVPRGNLSFSGTLDDDIEIMREIRQKLDNIRKDSLCSEASQRWHVKKQDLKCIGKVCQALNEKQAQARPQAALQLTKWCFQALPVEYPQTRISELTSPPSPQPGCNNDYQEQDTSNRNISGWSPSKICSLLKKYPTEPTDPTM